MDNEPTVHDGTAIVMSRIFIDMARRDNPSNWVDDQWGLGEVVLDGMFDLVRIFRRMDSMGLLRRDGEE